MKPTSSISLVVGLPDDTRTRREMRELNKKMGCSTGEKLPLINGYTVDVPEDRLESYLASLPDDATVMVNKPFRRDVAPSQDQEQTEKSRTDSKREAENATQGDWESAPLMESMPAISRPLGWEEVRAQGLDGSGVTLAVIDSGLYPHHDFGNRIKAFKNFAWTGSSKPGDEFGHGTHVAGIAAGDGEFVDGVAPGLSLVGAHITNPAEAIKAIDWVIANKQEYGINILNLSLGDDALLPGHQDPFSQATQRAIDAGILTVVAAGNEGKGGTVAGSISTPGILEDAITVGAYNDAQTAALNDDKMWGNSSLGPTKPEGLAKPDLVAPGAAILSTSAEGSDKRKSNPVWGDYHLDWGTSMATPMVGGALALMLQVNSKLTQKGAKDILKHTAIPLEGVDAYAQGAGRLNLAAAVKEARNWHPA